LEDLFNPSIVKSMQLKHLTILAEIPWL